MEEANLKVKGMTCQHCVRSVKNALEPMPGVKAVFVDLPNGEVKVHYEPGQADPAAFVPAIEEEGYEVVQ